MNASRNPEGDRGDKIRKNHNTEQTHKHAAKVGQRQKVKNEAREKKDKKDECDEMDSEEEKGGREEKGDKKETRG